MPSVLDQHVDCALVPYSGTFSYYFPRDTGPYVLMKPNTKFEFSVAN